MSEKVKRYNAKLASFDGQYRVVVLASDFEALANDWRVATGANTMLRFELATMRNERDALAQRCRELMDELEARQTK